MTISIILPESITTRKQLGQFGEDYVRAKLRKAGYDVLGTRYGTGGDLLACGLRIEVKTAYQNGDGGYRFCLCKDDESGRTDHRKSDVVILLCCSSAGLITNFVVPVAALWEKDHIPIPRLKNYHGKYAEYRSRLDRFHKWLPLEVKV
jgi:hypothetical protein